MNYLFTIYVGTSQIGAFFIAGFFFHHNRYWMISFCLSVLITAGCLWYGGIGASLKNIQDALLVFSENPGAFVLEEVNLDSIIPHSVEQRLAFRKFFSFGYFRKLYGLSAVYKPFRVFVVKSLCPPLLPQLKTYVNTEGTCMLFIRDKPEDLSTLGKFKLYHELGHISDMCTLFTREQYAVIARRTFTIVAVIPTLYFFHWLWPILLIYFLQQLYRERITMTKGIEMAADSFAFQTIGDHDSLVPLLSQLEDIYSEDLSSIVSPTESYDKKLQGMLRWRLMLLHWGKRRLAANKLPASGITFGGPDDLIMSGAFVYLAWHAVLPNIWIFLPALASLAAIPLLVGGHYFRYLIGLQKRLEDFVASTSSNSAT